MPRKGSVCIACAISLQKQVQLTAISPALHACLSFALLLGAKNRNTWHFRIWEIYWSLPLLSCDSAGVKGLAAHGPNIASGQILSHLYTQNYILEFSQGFISFALGIWKDCRESKENVRVQLGRGAAKWTRFCCLSWPKAQDHLVGIQSGGALNREYFPLTQTLAECDFKGTIGTIQCWPSKCFGARFIMRRATSPFGWLYWLTVIYNS